MRCRENVRLLSNCNTADINISVFQIDRFDCHAVQIAQIFGKFFLCRIQQRLRRAFDAFNKDHFCDDAKKLLCSQIVCGFCNGFSP